MKCPNCEYDIDQNDFKINVYLVEIEVLFVCPNCGFEFVSNLDPDDFRIVEP